MPKKLFNIILSMYANTTTRIKFSNGLSVAPDLLQNVESNKGMFLRRSLKCLLMILSKI
jgi:hypothetical protein